MVLFNLFSNVSGTQESNVYKNVLSIFFYLSEINDPNPNFYILQKFNIDFDAMVEKEKDN